MPRDDVKAFLFFIFLTCAISIYNFAGNKEDFQKWFKDGEIVIFKPNGTLSLFHHGWLKNDEFVVAPCNSEWCINRAPSSSERIDLNVQPAPRELYSAHLESKGKVSCWKQKNGIVEKYPAKFINGEWQLWDGGWVPIFHDD